MSSSVFLLANYPIILQLVNAISRHTHPNSVHLLFAYDYTRTIKDSRRHDNLLMVDSPPISSYLSPKDWQRELQRLGVTNDQWRISEANKHFLVCGRCCGQWLLVMLL